ncbi:phage integrase [Longimycelium tulufanense]|uniref:Phage integrase n=1 Tax=Longimycelium tulufanense TaxID=907463 RepID=A0A8J3CE03_9PSEU|nr:site-specific integrase [Longimycelium tulufanense]GGM53023.1 phage integrase [Longimycelium tulufanense]
MGRPPLDIGTHGKINTRCETPAGVTPEKWRAYTNYRDNDGKTRQVERWGPTENKALNALNRALRDRAGRSGTRLARNSRFADAAKIYIEQIRAKRKPTTYDNYNWFLEEVVLPAVGQLLLREITPARLDDLIDDLRDKRDFSTSSLRNVRIVLRGVLQVAVRREILAHNPGRDMSRIEGGPRCKPRALTAEQLADFLTKLDADERAVAQDLPDLLRFLFGTGARIGEALALRWCDCNLTDDPITIGDQTIPPRSIWINGNIVRVKEVGLVRHDGKTFAANRVVGLPDFLHTLLLVRKDLTAADEEPVFPSGVLTWRDPRNVGTAIRHLRQRIGYPDFTSHVARKTVATTLDRSGHTARQIADQLGHANPSMTQNVYMGRGLANPEAPKALDALHRQKESA